MSTLLKFNILNASISLQERLRLGIRRVALRSDAGGGSRRHVWAMGNRSGGRDNRQRMWARLRHHFGDVVAGWEGILVLREELGRVGDDWSRRHGSRGRHKGLLANTQRPRGDFGTCSNGKIEELALVDRTS